MYSKTASIRQMQTQKFPLQCDKLVYFNQSRMAPEDRNVLSKLYLFFVQNIKDWTIELLQQNIAKQFGNIFYNTFPYKSAVLQKYSVWIGIKQAIPFSEKSY